MIKKASKEDAAIILEVMLAAFKKYEKDEYPSSALKETVATIEADMDAGQKALLYEEKGQNVGMVRYELNDNELYFRRLSVIPSMQGKGIAKKIVKALEEIARELGKEKVACRVRKSEKGNLQLYKSLGFEEIKEDWFDREGGPMLIVLMEKEL